MFRFERLESRIVLDGTGDDIDEPAVEDAPGIHLPVTIDVAEATESEQPSESTEDEASTPTVPSFGLSPSGASDAPAPVVNTPASEPADPPAPVEPPVVTKPSVPVNFPVEPSDNYDTFFFNNRNLNDYNTFYLSPSTGGAPIVTPNDPLNLSDVIHLGPRAPLDLPDVNFPDNLPKPGQNDPDAINSQTFVIGEAILPELGQLTDSFESDTDSDEMTSELTKDRYFAGLTRREALDWTIHESTEADHSQTLVAVHHLPNFWIANAPNASQPGVVTPERGSGREVRLPVSASASPVSVGDRVGAHSYTAAIMTLVPQDVAARSKPIGNVTQQISDAKPNELSANPRVLATGVSASQDWTEQQESGGALPDATPRSGQLMSLRNQSLTSAGLILAFTHWLFLNRKKSKAAPAREQDRNWKKTG